MDNKPSQLGIDESWDDSKPHVTFYTDGRGRWLRRVWATQCSHSILVHDRCRGIEGHSGDHWRFGDDGSYHYKPHDGDPRREDVGAGMIPPGNSDYRTPLEMSRHDHIKHYEDTEVTDPAEIERLEQGQFGQNETWDRPASEEDMEMLLVATQTRWIGLDHRFGRSRNRSGSRIDVVPLRRLPRKLRRGCVPPKGLRLHCQRRLTPQRHWHPYTDSFMAYLAGDFAALHDLEQREKTAEHELDEGDDAPF